ncbi:MAG: trypsin-like peptidase domain-containing protein [Abditibacteriota bacterium]|nr:trypsin-like peptidase domain-containing protein [Abditibacteriota bacterium]
MKKFAGYAAIFVAGFLVCSLCLKFTGSKPSSAAPTAVPAPVSAAISGIGGNAIQTAADKVSKYVVNIDTVGKPQLVSSGFFGMSQQTPKGSASGVIISKDGYILTNNHVVQDMAEVTVTLYDNTSHKARVIGTDRKTDLAVIKIKADNLPCAVFADSDKIKVGEWVVAVGNALGIGQTVTCGIISAKRDEFDLNGQAYDSIIQTDAAINPGNSGGALSDLSGNLIGINTAIASQSGGSEGVGFAVPSNTAKQISDQLIKEGSIKRPYIGITMGVYNQEYRDQIQNQYGTMPGLVKEDGILVENVMEGSPAKKAGIERGDVITAIDGKKVKLGKDAAKSLVALSTAVGKKKIGERIKLTIIHNGQTVDYDVVLEEMPSQEELAKQAQPQPQPRMQPQPGEQDPFGGMFPFFGQP